MSSYTSEALALVSGRDGDSPRGGEKSDPSPPSFTSVLRAKSLAVFLTLATPGALTSLTGCSPESSSSERGSKPQYSSLVVSGDSPGIPLTSIASRLASLGEVHGPVQDALVATIAFSETPHLGDVSKVNGSTQSVMTLKGALQSAHRALSNAGNNKDLSAIRGEIEAARSVLADLMVTISSQEGIEKSWNRSALDDQGQMRGVSIALKAQEKMEKMVAALDEDMASLIPGYELSRVVFFSEVIGGANGVITEIGAELKVTKRDDVALVGLRKKLADSIQSINGATNDPTLTKLASGTQTLLAAMTALHTSLASGVAPEKVSELQERAQSALEKIQIVEQNAQKELSERHYSGGGGVFVYRPWLYHWYGTGHASPYSSWHGATGFNSTSNFSHGTFAPGEGGGHGGVAAPKGTGFGKVTGGGFKGSSFGKAPSSSGFKAGGFGATGGSFGGRGIS